MLGKVCKFGEMFSSSRPKCIMIISRKLENLLVEEKKNEDKKKSEKWGDISCERWVSIRLSLSVRPKNTLITLAHQMGRIDARKAVPNNGNKQIVGGGGRGLVMVVTGCNN